MENNWHALSIEETISLLQTNTNGLTSQEVKNRLLKVGPNKLETHKGPSFLFIFFRQLFNPLVLILIGATIIKFFVADILTAGVLAGTILIMALIGFFQEVKAEYAMRALKQLTAHKSKIKRDGKWDIFPSETIVPGDVIMLEAGDKIPADARLLETANFKVNESTFNGESIPIEKYTETLSGKLSLADKRNMVYMGTTVSSGKAMAVIVSTGMKTELGKITSSIQEIVPEKTPLQKNIHAIGMWMILIVFVAILIFFVISYYRGMGWSEILLLGVAAAVSAIPEGLPAAFTISLAAGISAMAKRNAIIRKLVAVETLGSTTVICSDKTGTLTLNKITVKCLCTLGKIVHVNGDGTSTKGDFFLNGNSIDPKTDPPLKQMLEIGVLCNDALITKKNHDYEIFGDPTEGALLIAAAKTGLMQEQLEALYPRIDTIPFVSENLYMATLHSSEKAQKLFLKGAPEKILSFSNFVLKGTERIPLGEKEKQEITEMMALMAKEAFRLIAVAFCDVDIHEGHLKEEIFKGKLIFVGFFGMMDSPREEAVEAIAACKRAGIKVVMVTGDNKITAEAIAKEIGISDHGVISGEEIQALSDQDLKKMIKTIHIFARVEPLHKLRIVQAFKAIGEIVAVTGDGVNDAPALEAANIGISMGISGTDVAKEASDMVLGDDNFATIVAAIEEGRAIFNRLRNVCVFLLTTCIGELFGLILSVFFIGFAPLLPLQILWINLISGVMIAIPIGMEPKKGDELTQSPRDARVKLIFPGMVYYIGFLAFLLGLSIFLVFRYAFLRTDIFTAHTMVICNIVIFEWLIAFNCRSDEVPVFKIGIFKNKALISVIALAFVLQMAILYLPFLRKLFSTAPLSFWQWIFAIIPGVVIFLIDTIRKTLFPTLFSFGKWKK